MKPTKISYTSGVSTKPLLGLTIGELFDRIVEKYPDEDALIVCHQDIRLTYRQLKGEVDQCARAFLSLGLKKGDRVGIWSQNNLEWVLTQFATSKLGLILVNINPSYRLHELEYVLKQSGCKAIVLADQFKYSNYTQMIYDLAPELLECERGHLIADKVPDMKIVIRLHDQRVPGMFSWDEIMEMGKDLQQEALEEIQNSLQFDEPINIQYTSGTTGFPKGVALTHHNILNNGFFVGENMKLVSKDRVIIPVPLYHCFGMVLGNLATLSHGATMIYPSEGFDAKETLEAVSEEKATVLYGVPTMFIAELDHPDFQEFDLSTLRTGIMAGAPCPVEVMKEVMTDMHMKEVTIAYGMTETSPVSTQTRTNDPIEKRVNSVGKIMPHTEIKIIDPDTGVVVPLETAGELCTRGYCVMLGYWNNREATKKAVDMAHWMHTGDLATMDEDGYINIVGRIKDMVIRGGENIYPREIEEFLYSHPKVSEVQVVGVPDEKYGEELMAWIKLKEGLNAESEEIREYCKGKIAHYKIPRYYKFVDEFPMTVTGKIRKVEMRQISIQELGLDEAASIKTA
ncbi:MAG: AMP-binding protein [Bacteroidetes bacterium]|nr:AMP-binding protein [Bacteroidota bacterium]